MARESERAARLAEADGCLRSAANRYYYAAYQAMTAILLYRGLTPPADREAWSHDETPSLIEGQQPLFVGTMSQRRDMAHRLRELYKVRLIADYSGTHDVAAGKVATARKSVGYLFKVADSVLPER